MILVFLTMLNLCKLILTDELNKGIQKIPKQYFNFPVISYIVLPFSLMFCPNFRHANCQMVIEQLILKLLVVFGPLDNNQESKISHHSPTVLLLTGNTQTDIGYYGPF